MVDYIESILRMRQHLRSLEKALIENKIVEARALCTDMTAESRLLYQQLAMQFPEETGHVVELRSKP